jgi:hypothetical protein
MIVGDQSLNVANLEVIKFEKIAAKDPVETLKLLKAAESSGFFFFSFNDPLEGKISDHLRTSYLSSHHYFAKPLDEKMKDFRADVDRGYVGLFLFFVLAALLADAHTFIDTSIDQALNHTK